MKNWAPPLLGCAFLSLACADDLPPPNARQLLQELQDLKTKQEAAANNSQRRNLDLIFKAASSKEAAIALYGEAQMATQFQGVNRENTQFRDWKKREEDQLKDGDFRESVRLHLYYLGLTLRKAAEAKPAELTRQVADYLIALNGAGPALAVKNSLLKVPVNEGIFTKWLVLGSEVDKAGEWELNPSHAEDIAAEYLLPQWRKLKDPALLAYWDARINQESAIATGSALDFDHRNFAAVRKPHLLWQRAQEYFALEQPNKGTQEMFALIKAFPNHPEVGQWIAALQEKLQPKSAPEASPAGVPAPVPQP